MRPQEISDRSTRLLKAQYYMHRNVSKSTSMKFTPLHNTYQKIPTERTMRRREWFAHKPVNSSRKHLDAHLPAYTPLKKDPLKLAEEVRGLLENDLFELALRIVRDASRTIQCTVSWNHLIGWLLSKSEMKNAIKLYQEMKKRAQIPDAHTYTIIFRGCSQSNHPKQALGKVMAIYQSMLLDKSPVKANIIHINAVLKMCAVAADIDCMLSIVAGLPSEGIQAADHVTFAIVLNALRYHALSRLPTPLSPEQLRQKTRAMILQAQQIWREVIKRWRNGNIWIDEELVCSMGRILLASQEKTHWDEILSLVEQTMAIPRQLPCFGPAWHSENIAQTQIGPQTTSAGDIPTYYAITNNLLPENSSSSSIISHESNNQSLSTIPGASAYAKPGQNTLSLVLDASFLLSSKETAKKYWNMLTQEYHVTPDLDNYMAYLRILRVCRASSDAVHLLGSMPQEKMAAKVFRIAMSSCVRDKNNHHSFSNSGKILDMMQRSLKTPDVKTMMRYLHLAMCPPSNTHKNPPSSKLLLSDKYLGSQILRALDRVYELLLNLKSIIFFKDPALDKQSDRHEFLVDLEMLVARLITAHLRLIKYRMVPSELIPELRMRRGELSNLKRRLYRYKKSIGASNKETIKDSAGDEINTFEDINSRCPSDLISGKNLMTTKDLN